MLQSSIIILIIYPLLINFNNGLELLPYSDPSQCNTSEFFNVETLSCEMCNAKLFLIPDTKMQQCDCTSKRISIYSPPLNTPKCIPCPLNKIYSKELKKCIKCGNGIIKKNNNIMCKPCKPNEIIIFYTRNGTAMYETRCIECSAGMVPSDNNRECLPCPILNPVISNGTVKCFCDYKSVLLDNVCVSTDIFPELSNDKKSYFLQYSNKKQVKSLLFDKYLKSNIYLCKLKNTTACQFLANLCTLTLFNNYENSPCEIWLESRFSANPEKTRNLPWLFYREGDANVILNHKKISAQYSLKSSSPMNMLNLTTIVFNIDGTLKKISQLQGADLNLCPGTNLEKNKSLRFGINFEYSCQVDAKQFFDYTETEFLVPYLQYLEDNKSFLYAVPVLIKNIGHNNDYDTSNWLLVRRFFIIDKISSIELDKPTILQYVKSVELRIKVQDGADRGMIYPPLIVLEYGEMTREDYEEKKIIDFKYSIRFYLPTNMARSIEISIGVLSALAIVYSGIQTWTYYRRCGSEVNDPRILVNLFVFLCSNLANAFFIVAFGTSVHTFIFYKGQNVVHLLLPSSEDEHIIKSFIIVAFSLKIIEIISMITKQVTVDIFLIDWERPRPQDTIPRPDTSSGNSEESISVWRSLFIANEWNEIQTRRKINLIFHMILLTFFLQVIGLEFWGTSDTQLHTIVPEHLSKTPYNFICRFAVGSLFYVILYSLQLLFAIGLYERYIKNAIQEFVDICSLANISIFIMSLERFGFYIHGRSSHGFSDTDMATMIKQLKREEDDLCGYRGLLPGTYQQTFTVGVPAKLRLYYNKLMTTTFSISNSTYPTDHNPRDQFKASGVDKIVKAYHNINRFLCAFLEHALKDLDYDVKDKLIVEKLLDIEFTDTYHRGVLYTDNGHSFDNVLFYGNEFTLFSFDLIVFSFILMLSDNFILSILMTISIAELLKIFRKFAGKKNLSRKTLIDRRFLI